MSKFLLISLQAELIWSEDDVTTRQKGHENIARAFTRLTGFHFEKYKEQSIEIFCLNESDCETYLTPIINGSQYILLLSYPGNNSIYKIIEGHRMGSRDKIETRYQHTWNSWGQQNNLIVHPTAEK